MRAIFGVNALRESLAAIDDECDCFEKMESLGDLSDHKFSSSKENENKQR